MPDPPPIASPGPESWPPIRRRTGPNRSRFNDRRATPRPADFQIALPKARLRGSGIRPAPLKKQRRAEGCWEFSRDIGWVQHSGSRAIGKGSFPQVRIRWRADHPVLILPRERKAYTCFGREETRRIGDHSPWQFGPGGRCFFPPLEGRSGNPLNTSALRSVPSPCVFTLHGCSRAVVVAKSRQRESFVSPLRTGSLHADPRWLRRKEPADPSTRTFHPCVPVRGSSICESR